MEEAIYWWLREIEATLGENKKGDKRDLRDGRGNILVTEGNRSHIR
jgi:hypothetical protein